MKKLEFIQEVREHEGITLEKTNDYHYTECYYLKFASYGDYGNSCTIERANYRDLENSNNSLLTFHSGGYNSEMCLINIDEIKDIRWNKKYAREATELIDTLNGLSDYPAINDETASEIEHELQEESWNNCYESDFVKELENHFNIPFSEYEYNETNLKNFFDEQSEKQNLYWEIEAGGNAYFPIVDLVKNIELSDLSDIFYKNFSPTYEYSNEAILVLRAHIEALENVPIQTDLIQEEIEKTFFALAKKESELLCKN